MKWVNDGCPGGIFEGYSYRIPARALADDRYISITGKGPTWAATITQLGVELLKSISDSDANNDTHQSEADKFIQKLIAADGVLEARHFPDDVDEHPVPVPDSVSKYHPVAKVFRDGTRGVSKDHVARAAKLLHALATESTARGYEVTLPSSNKRSDTRGPTSLDGDIAITIGTTTVPLEMRELPRTAAPHGHTSPNTTPATGPGRL